MITEKMTSGQIAQYGKLGEEVAKAAATKVSKKLLKENVQKAFGNKALQKRLEKAAEEILLDLAMADKYKREEVKSNYGYLSGYRAPKPVAAQIALLQGYDWGRQVEWELTDPQKAMVAQKQPGEGLGVIVFDETMITNHEENASIDFGVPLMRMQGFIKQSRGSFYDWREGKWDRRYYRRSTASAEALKELWIAQCSPNGILLVPFQFGIAHAGKSPRRALELMVDEFGLGAYEILTLVLTHPERLSNYNDLWIDCPGDEYSDNGAGVFSLASFVGFYDGGVGMGAGDLSSVLGNYGSASGFSAVKF